MDSIPVGRLNTSVVLIPGVAELIVVCTNSTFTQNDKFKADRMRQVAGACGRESREAYRSD